MENKILRLHGKLSNEESKRKKISKKATLHFTKQAHKAHSTIIPTWQLNIIFNLYLITAKWQHLSSSTATDRLKKCKSYRPVFVLYEFTTSITSSKLIHLPFLKAFQKGLHYFTLLKYFQILHFPCLFSIQKQGIFFSTKMTIGIIFNLSWYCYK